MGAVGIFLCQAKHASSICECFKVLTHAVYYQAYTYVLCISEYVDMGSLSFCKIILHGTRTITLNNLIHNYLYVTKPERTNQSYLRMHV